MKIETYIDALISYATMRELIRPEDHDVAVNKLLEILQLDDYTPSDEQLPGELEEILMGLLDYACSRGLCQDNVTARDLFDTKLMDLRVNIPLEEALDLGWEILAQCFEPNETGLKSSLIQERWPKPSAAE